MNTTLDFAREQLDAYSRRIFGTDNGCKIEFVVKEAHENAVRDGYEISIDGGKGAICGKNERSILLGVYGALKQIGCRFVRPGANGEKIPRLALENFNVHVCFTPSYDHRGITIEGAVSEEYLKDLIDWMPKAGLNSYFVQFRSGYEFYERWYRHENNPLLAPEPFDGARAQKIHENIVREIKKRGLIFHAVGHGWTCECLGISSTGWHKAEKVPENIRPYLAKINGERKFFKDICMNTQLCYSRREVREKLVDEVVGYAKIHPEIDVLHFWLADDFNNLCECEKCSKSSHADLYIRMLNEIDARLTHENLSVKIAFLVYLELYWPPEKEKIANQDRFILMFAPIFRSFSRPYLDGYDRNAQRKIPVFRRNQMEYPRDIETYLAFLREWQKHFSGDGFDFDYHLMWDIHRDFSGLTLSKIINQDIRSLKDMKLNGLLSCQVQRAFFPSPLAMNIMSATLSDRSVEFESYKKTFFADVYEGCAPLAEDIFRTVQKYVSYEYFRDNVKISDSASLEDFKRALDYLRAKQEQLNEILECDGANMSAFLLESMRQLHFYVETMALLLPAVIAKGEGSPKEYVMGLYEKLHRRICEQEARSEASMDAYYYHFIVKGFLEQGEMVNHGGI